MNSLVCVNCLNSKPVNLTDNRLVTESCGHVKCMKCLLYEKAGCAACLKEKKLRESNDRAISGVEVEVELVEVEEGGDSPGPKEENRDFPTPYDGGRDSQSSFDDGRDPQQGYVERDIKISFEEFSKKQKPETSHIKIEIDGNGRCYVCTVCKKRFHARSQVAYHAYCNGQRKPFQCPDCNKSFATHSHFKYHMRVHRNERTYACDVCGDAFFQMSKLQRHKLKHTKEKKFICAQCDKGFTNLPALRKHTLTHTEERPYACSACGRRFRDGSNYRKHVAKHDGDKKCGCGGGCGGWRCVGGRGAGVARGRGPGRADGGPGRVEGGTGRAEGGTGRAVGERRAHQCPRCPQAFHSSKDMRRHAAVHTDSKPFRCKVCMRRFRRKDNLERHIRNTHPDFVTSSAVECDETALKQIAVVNGSPRKEPQNEKNKLEKLNPLPPLPQEVIQKHITEPQEPVDKSYILVANNARQSVIVEKRQANIEKQNPMQEFEYVHKIRKASHKDNIQLPPINIQKVYELDTLNKNTNQIDNISKLEIGMPTKDKRELYERILYDRIESEEASVDTSADIHWRRKKMKLL